MKENIFNAYYKPLQIRKAINTKRAILVYTNKRDTNMLKTINVCQNLEMKRIEILEQSWLYFFYSKNIFNIVKVYNKIIYNKNFIYLEEKYF